MCEVSEGKAPQSFENLQTYLHTFRPAATFGFLGEAGADWAGYTLATLLERQDNVLMNRAQLRSFLYLTIRPCARQPFPCLYYKRSRVSG